VSRNSLVGSVAASRPEPAAVFEERDLGFGEHRGVHAGRRPERAVGVIPEESGGVVAPWADDQALTLPGLGRARSCLHLVVRVQGLADEQVVPATDVQSRRGDRRRLVHRGQLLPGLVAVGVSDRDVDHPRQVLGDQRLVGDRGDLGQQPAVGETRHQDREVFSDIDALVTGSKCLVQ